MRTGAVLLTSSAIVLLLPRLVGSLANRMKLVRLMKPLACEIQHVSH
jgi:hypothetical protein